MYLTGAEILKQMALGMIHIDPFDPKCLGPNSYDVHITDRLLTFENYILDTKKRNPTKETVIPETGYTLMPGLVYLACSKSYTETKYPYIPELGGKSTTGRLGLTAHVTAGGGDLGFAGDWTLEITCVQPIVVYPYLKIGQLYWIHSVGEDPGAYHGRYQGQRGIRPPDDLSGLYDE